MMGHLRFRIMVPMGKRRKIRDVTVGFGISADLSIKCTRGGYAVITMRKEQTPNLPLILDFFQKIAPILKDTEYDKQLVVIRSSMGNIKSVDDVEIETVLFWKGTAWSFTPEIKGVARLTDPGHLGLNVSASLSPMGVGHLNRGKSFEVKGVIQGNTKPK